MVLTGYEVERDKDDWASSGEMPDSCALEIQDVQPLGKDAGLCEGRDSVSNGFDKKIIINSCATFESASVCMGNLRLKLLLDAALFRNPILNLWAVGKKGKRVGQVTMGHYQSFIGSVEKERK